MKKLLFACAVASVFIAAPAMAQSDAKAKTVLDAVSNKVKSLKSFSASFTFKLTGGKGGSVTDTKKGTLSVKGEKYHVTVDQTEIICDAKTVWNYNKQAKEVQVSAYNPADQGMSPAKLLTNTYEKEYNYAYKGERKNQGKSCDVIELTPKTNSQKVQKIELLVDKSTSMISGGTYWEKSGNKYEYTISNFKSNADIKDALFTWDPKIHPGVETIDLR